MTILDKEDYGEWALITGASSGLGREFAKQLASNGFNVILVARSEKLLRELSKSLTTEFDIKTKVIITNLEDDKEIQNLMDECKAVEIGLLVNCAGLALSNDFLSNSISDEINILNVNVKAPLLLTHFFGQKMKERKRGGIIFVSSIMAFAGASTWANYNATKSHNLVLAEGIAQELKKDNVHVLALVPGTIRTGFQKKSQTTTVLGALEVKEVALDGLTQLGKKRTYTSGFKNKFIAFLTRMMPRIVNTSIFSSVVEKIKK